MAALRHLKRRRRLLLQLLGLLVCARPLQGVAPAPRESNNYNVTTPLRLAGQPGPRSVLSYRVAAGGFTYTLRLQQNLALLSPGFVIYAQRNSGQRVPDSKLFQEDCYYQGFIEGVPGSVVALSTCYGLGGFLQTETVAYAIQPLKGTATFEHIVYRLEDVDIEPKTCFTGRPELSVEEELHKKQQRKGGHHQAAHQTHYMRLYVVVDRELFQYYSQNITVVSNIVFNVMNMADAMFTSLSLKLVLVGLEIWNMENGVPAPENMNTFLRNLGNWKEKNVIPSLKTEMTVLLRKDGIQSNVGATFTREICSGYNAVMFVAIAGDVLQVAATQLAHELGHSLGIPHDTGDCRCPLSSCIMLPTAVATTSFSGCSAEYYTSLIDRGGGYCLPTASADILLRQHPHPYCGNKIIEGKEECDCGATGDCANDPCCDDTCKLKVDAKCSHGECCIECQFVKIGTVCRKPASECDLAEYCDGATPFCPDDVYSQDGTPCNHNQSYCVSNRCYDYAKHCKTLFGKGAHVASKECFTQVNTIGDQFGNCGFEDNGISPKKCEPPDVMCGRVQCDATQIEHIYQSHSTTIETRSGQKMCWSVGYHYSLFDIGAVEDGAKCDSGRVCLHRKCVSISQLNYDCDVKHTCNGHGVCNNNRNCHCHKGWAPPDCKHKGNGGSIDSGPLVPGSFVTYTPPKQELKVIEPRYECPLETKRKRELMRRRLAIGLGITLAVLLVGSILGIIFRHQIMGLFKKR